MRISARVKNSAGYHDVTVTTNDLSQPLSIAPKATGNGSAVNGGELLMLALATCFCNDLYREAQRLGIAIDGVEVEATAQFDGVGLAARDIRYKAHVESSAPRASVAKLIRETDAVAEVHNTIRAGIAVVLSDG